MKNILLVTLLVGIVAISGCVGETAETPVDGGTDEPQDQAQQEQEQQQEQTTFQPLSSSAKDAIIISVEKLSYQYIVTDFTSSNDMTSITIDFDGTYRETDTTKIFRLLRDESMTRVYEITFNREMGEPGPEDDMICTYRDSVEKIDGFIAKKWVGWQDEIAVITC